MAVNIAVNMASFIDDLVQHSDKPKWNLISLFHEDTQIFC